MDRLKTIGFTADYKDMGKCVSETINDIKWQYQQCMYGNRVISNLFDIFNQKKDEVEIGDIINLCYRLIELSFEKVNVKIFQFSVNIEQNLKY
jgi:hypothetical protein